MGAVAEAFGLYDDRSPGVNAFSGLNVMATELVLYYLLEIRVSDGKLAEFFRYLFFRNKAFLSYGDGTELCLLWKKNGKIYLKGMCYF